MNLTENFSLKNYNTFRIDAYAKYFGEFFSADSLIEILRETKNIQKLILGGGSNILFTQNFDGIILKNSIPGINVINDDDEYVYIKAGAGVNWHQFVMYCVSRNFGGVENLSLIPGNTGASPMQNIGAYGTEIKDVFFELEALHIEENSLQKFNNTECGFGYRDSVFKKKYKGQFVILNVTFRLKKNPVFNISYGAIEEELKKMDVEKLSIKAISDAVINIRKSKLPDPELIGNAGSFFKNPEIDSHALDELTRIDASVPNYKIDDDTFKIPAGWLIEERGWKGYRKGDAGCYQKQALVLVNYGQANGKEIYDLSQEIKHSVFEKFRISLEREVNIV
ncbi:MAG: UDP-N-acetylmuramate dehydrogenase [Ginsengibacter sp.]